MDQYLRLNVVFESLLACEFERGVMQNNAQLSFVVLNPTPGFVDDGDLTFFVGHSAASVASHFTQSFNAKPVSLGYAGSPPSK